MSLDASTARAARTLVVVSGSLSLAACLIVPTPEISEIRDTRLEFIQPGVTTRQELEAELSSRDVFLARVSEPYAIYAEYRDSFGFLVLAPNGGDGEIYGNVDDYLVVEYDQSGRVVQYERLTSEGDCTSYGLCVRGGSERDRDEESRKDPRSLVVLAPLADDEPLKTFEPIAGACSVYVYTSGCDSEDVDIESATPGPISRQPTRAHPDGYFHWSVPLAGGSTGGGVLVATPVGARPYHHQYDCAAGDLVFVDVQLSECGIGTPWVDFSQPLSVAGKREVSLRRLILE